MPIENVFRQFVALDGLLTRESFSIEIKEQPLTLVTTDPDLLLKLLHEYGKETFGKPAWNGLSNAVKGELRRPFIIQEVVLKSDNLLHQLLYGATAHLIGAIMQFETALWLGLDHSLRAETVFMMGYDGKERIVFQRGTGLIYANAFGRFPETEVSQSDIEIAAQRLKVLPDWTLVETYEVKPHPIALHGFTRLERVWFLLHLARLQYILPFRIANYVVCLESLLSDTHNEIRHQLAERAAFLTGRTPAKRKTLYRRMQGAYDVRSATIHGSGHTNDEKTYCSLSKSCDDTLRRIMAVNDQSQLVHEWLFSERKSESDKKKFREHINKLLFT